mmetsp:Transcript_5674/g.10755  ORF Transcript_5674/g.10755 Transcript_5674/m.10755 type:complete len:227 (-) Transcript_5674:1777-2457(-)
MVLSSSSTLDCELIPISLLLNSSDRSLSFNIPISDASLLISSAFSACAAFFSSLRASFKASISPSSPIIRSFAESSSFCFACSFSTSASTSLRHLASIILLDSLRVVSMCACSLVMATICADNAIRSLRSSLSFCSDLALSSFSNVNWDMVEFKSAFSSSTCFFISSRFLMAAKRSCFAESRVSFRVDLSWLNTFNSPFVTASAFSSSDTFASACLRCLFASSSLL